MPINPIYCALDTKHPADAHALAQRLKPHVGGIKLGLEFFCANGPAGVRDVAAADLPIFLDLKLHDIPNTVAGAVESVVGLSPALLTIHTQGGPAMMRAAREAAIETAGRLGVPRPRLIGVTVLTSLDDDDLSRMGHVSGSADQVRRLAGLAAESGLDGVVCSPLEVALLRQDLGTDFDLIVPGIRPAESAAGDQKRVMTPPDACKAGASILVIGRPITTHDDPEAAARSIAASVMDHLPA